MIEVKHVLLVLHYGGEAAQNKVARLYAIERRECYELEKIHISVTAGCNLTDRRLIVCADAYELL